MAPGMKVLELGSTSEGISEVLVQQVRSQRSQPTVVSIDLESSKNVHGVKYIKDNFLSKKVITEVMEHFDYESVDLIVSNMEPKVRGDLDRDQLNMMEKNLQTYFLATKLLKRGGTI